MKYIAKIFLTALAAFTLWSSANAQTNFIVISPHLPDTQSKAAILNGIANTALSAPPSSRFAVLDGRNGRQISELEIPATENYRAPSKAKKTALALGLQSLHGWLKTAALGDSEPYALDLPRVFQHLERSDAIEEGSQLVILGSPLYTLREQGQATFAMTGGYLPSDGCAFGGLSETPFGLAGSEGRLTGISQAHWAYFGDYPFLHSGHQAAVERWWSGWMEIQSVRLTSLSSDLNTVLKGLTQSDREPLSSHSLESGGRILMNQIPVRIPAKDEPVSVSDEPVSLQGAPDVGFMVTDRLASTPPASQIANDGLAIGVKWQGGADMDIYVVDGSKPELSFRKPLTEYGKHVKDFTSNASGEAFETVELVGPVNLQTLRVFVNYWGGPATSGGLPGTIRISIAGQVYEAPFLIEAEQGNRGEDMEEARDGKHWQQLHPLQIVGLE